MIPTPERWASIAGYVGYLVSNHGRVSHDGFILKPSVGAKGYSQVNLLRDGKRCTKSVHRLVAKAFVDNPHDLPQINHEDGCKTNNFATNLTWSTGSQNMLHAYRTGLRVAANQYTKRAQLIAA